MQAVFFYLAGALAVVSTLLMLTRLNVVHALLYLVVSLLAVAVAFFAMGAPLVGALEIVVYAGAIMVLFVFVIMLFNLGGEAIETERQWLPPGAWITPVAIGCVLLAEAFFLVMRSAPADPVQGVPPKDVALALFGPYAIGVELASMLLLAGLIGSYHLGWQGQVRDAAGADVTDSALESGVVRTGDGTSGGPGVGSNKNW
jgi:NADH-quinone oxidoreductase subunit J